MRRTSRRGTSQLVVRLAIVLALTPAVLGWSAGAALAQQAGGQGETIFQSKCAACHTIGAGPTIGPDLKGVTARRSREWLVSWISAPDQLIARRDPTAKELTAQYAVQMPNLGLTGAETEAVVAFLQAVDAGTLAQPVPAQQVATAPGDPAIGKEYFSGVRRFQNGGPPCMACHSLAGLGALGGGALGPDLTTAWTRFGATGLASVLATTPYPTMNPIFGPRPLTPEEQAHLLAFLEQATVAERSPEALGQLALLSVVGAAALFGLAAIWWRRRLVAVRRPLLSRRPA